MDKQAVFDKVRYNLLKQNARSIIRGMFDDSDSGVFAYKTTVAVNVEGERKNVRRRCSIGHLISHLYHEDMEGLPVKKLLVEFPAVARHLDVKDDSDVALLVALQSVHDFLSVKQWDVALAQVARYFKLEHPNPELYRGEPHENDPGFKQSSRPYAGGRDKNSVQAPRREPALV